MNKSIPFRINVASALLCLILFASCSADDDTALPEGKYPMTFATAMEGLTQTRATTDNTWAGDEKIAVQVGSEVKEYIPTASGAEATLTGVDAANTFYWQKAEETVSAWYSGAGYTAQLSSFSVKTDQSTDVGYRQSDFLYAKPQDITYSSRTTNQLTFGHLPAKVIVHLKNGNGVTAEEVADATVRIVSQETTSGMINAEYGTVGQITNSGAGAITPNVLDAPKPGFQKSVQAIVVPQQVVKGTQFIKVTIGKNDDARDYYYTPKNDNDANLECGKQYTYDITVTKGEELKVTDQTTVFWKDVEAQSGSVEPAVSFNVTCPGNGNGVENFEIVGVNLPLSGDKYTVNVDTPITISYTTDLKRSRYNLVQGIAKVTTSTNTAGTITLEVSDIRGDLVFSFDEYAEVGDYYYADGSWSPDYTSDNDSPACIGIVFKVGAGTGDDASYYGAKLPKGIHGYVAALRDANNGNQLAWSTEDTATGVSTSQANFDGYSNTQIIKRISGYETKYPAFQSCIENNGTAAPAASSGWYLPSCAQIKAFHDVHGSVGANFNTASGELLITNNTGDYWTSNEESGNRTNAWHFTTYYAPQPFFKDHSKTATNKDLVRAILTF